MKSCRKYFLISLLPLYLLVPVFFSLSLAASVEQIDSFEALNKNFRALNSNDLLVLDIDEVLLTEEDAILSPSGDSLRAQIYNYYFEQAETLAEKEQVAEILMLPLLTSSKKLVEKSWPALIEELQNAGIKIIALTSCPIEIVSGSKNLEQLRLNQLKEKNIVFKDSFPGLKRLSIPFSNVPYEGKNPVYNEGILFTGALSKADALWAFFNEIGWRPQTLVFVDNLLINVQRMEVKMLQEQLVHKGIHYQYVEKKGQLLIDPDLAKKQFEHLFEYKEWLNDNEAKARYFSKT